MRAAWAAAIGLAVALRLSGALLEPGLYGYDAWAHLAYVLFLDLYRSVPYADQGWGYFHPPLHYALGWLLAQFGSADALVRGLALLGSAASLGIAWLAAHLVRRALPERPFLSVLAFVAVAFLPVHVYASPMPGNEMTAAFFSSAAIVAFLARPGRAPLARDAASGALVGLALLTKFSGLIPLLAIAASLVLQAVRGAVPARRAAARLGVVAGIALLLAGPYYARNVAEYGTPFQLGRDTPVMRSVEEHHPPGERGWRDFVALSPRLLVDPTPRADHLLHSVWGSAFVNAWCDTRGRMGRSTRSLLVIAGLIPSALALTGFAISLAGAWRDPRATTDATLLLLAATSVAAFAGFAWRVPIFSALKASYLLNLSLPYGFFLARALAAARPRAVRRAGALAVAAVAGLAALLFVPGLALRPLPENAQMAVVRAHFGELDAARATLRDEIHRHSGPRPLYFRSLRGSPVWLREALAAVELRAGDAAAARALYREAAALPRADSPHLSSHSAPQRLNRQAVAAALDGDRAAARGLLDRALEAGPVTEPLVNRGALRALAGDLEGAEADLRSALERAPALAPAARNLAWVLERSGRAAQARSLRDTAEDFARRAPRGFPYGVGDGFHLNEQRFMLVIENGTLALYRPARARTT